MPIASVIARRYSKLSQESPILAALPVAFIRTTFSRLQATNLYAVISGTHRASRVTVALMKQCACHLGRRTNLHVLVLSIASRGDNVNLLATELSATDPTSQFVIAD